jgi:hypothetical protein
MTRTRKLACAIASVVAMTIVASGAIATTGAASTNDSGNQLVGTWSVKVSRPAPLPPLTSLQVFTDDGSVIEDANEWSATRTPAYGSWERVDGRLYANSTMFFRFNPQTGAYLGAQKISRTIRLAEDGQSLTIVARVTVLDPDGNIVGTFGASAAGERMQVERVPDQS